VIETRQVLLSWSGGKDSALTLAALRADPSVEVAGLLTSITREYDRISIHGVRRTILEAQAAELGLPLIEIPLAPECSNADYELAFGRSLNEARQRFPSCTTVAFGDLFLSDVRDYRERLVRQCGFEAVFPLWERETSGLARGFIDSGFKATLVCVDTTQLDRSFAGRRFDFSLLTDLPAAVDPCGERGEFHTCVTAGPIFRREIAVELGEVVLRDERFAYCDLVPLPSDPTGAFE
jgi:uncharacterized protein (TIGR00290 family)